MAKYNLRIFCDSELLERFENRQAKALKTLLEHPRFHRGWQTGPFGEIEKNPNRFEIFDNQMEKISNANINNTIDFLGTLR